jgi:hypothetical protein
VYALVAASNQKQLDEIGTYFHLDKTSIQSNSDYQSPSVTVLTASMADATDYATVIALVNDLNGVLDMHFTDTIAHDTATSAAITMADATDTATGILVANEQKEQLLLHQTGSNIHYLNDTANATTAADATDEATLILLANDIKLFLTPHIASAPPGHIVNIVEA